jgi:hypothetical protein
MIIRQMKKALKTYQEPVASYSYIASLQLLTPTGGGTLPGEPQIDPNPDDSDEDPRSKDRNQGEWASLW